jgi:hypothetical protein
MPNARDGVMERRYERFERVTVRAAGRLLRGRHAAGITPSEAEEYLRELVSLDAHATPAAYKSLRRLADARAPRREAGIRTDQSLREPRRGAPLQARARACRLQEDPVEDMLATMTAHGSAPAGVR